MGKITIRDVAREAGVSISLVSLVMNAKRDAEGNLDCNVNKDTARRIAEVAKRLGYRPNKAAASLRSGRFYTIGMVTSDIANQFFADIARYIENIAHNYNYTVLFGSSDENAEKLDNIVDTFIGNGVEGLIVAPCSGSEEVLRKALDAGIPTVLLDRDIAGLDVGRVMLDNERAGRMGVEHLYENGYRRIEMISYTLGISSLSERERGYCEAMRRYGLEGYSQIHYTVYGHAQEDTVRIFEDAVRRGVEAFLLPTNTLALLGLQALNALNLSAPEDLALVGFDESEIFSLYKPSVTYITQSTRRLGEQSFEMLRRMIAGDNDCRSVVIEPELIVGGSTACIHPERVEAGREHAAGVAELTPRDSVLLPGTYFRHKGGWTADPQFMEQMGSSYLLAHGLGTPVEDAVTKIEIPQSGQYRIFVRTKNWTAHWADKEKHAPGAFRLRIDGRDCDTLFGTGDPEWHWQAGGTTYLTEGVHQVALHDLAGFDARCDAILFTLHDVAPDDSLETVFRLRNNLLGLPAEPEERGTFDFVVAGGGVAGMEAALSCALRGHTVVLYEKTDRLGGQALLSDPMWFKKEMKLFHEYLERQIKKRPAITVVYNTEATREIIEENDFDAVIVAVGAEQVVPRIPGVEKATMSFDVFGHEDKVGKKVVIIGGGAIGVELGIHLSGLGHECTIVEMAEYLASKAQLTERTAYLINLEKNHVASMVNTTCQEITDKGVWVENEDGRQFIEADTVIISVGTKPLAKERDQFKDVAFDVISVGDCVEASSIVHAVHTGFDAGLTL